jgi:hypothetical protein
MGKDQRRLLPPHLDLHLEVFVPRRKRLLQQEEGIHRIPSAGLDGWKKLHNHDVLYYM